MMRLLILLMTMLVLSGCSADEKKQAIIPQNQLNGLQKARSAGNVVDDANQRQHDAIDKQINQSS